MSGTNSRRVAAVLALVLLPASLIASEIGRFIADQVDVNSYRNYLDNELYTRTGHNRGMSGAQHDLARDRIAAHFQSFFLDVQLQEFRYGGQQGENVIATQRGTKYPGAMFIIGAHYDSVNNPGADDDASGVAGLLEIARVLSQYETEFTVRYIAFDMEELGLIGSDYYVNTHRGDDIRGMIQLDMIAYSGGYRATRIYGRSSSEPLKSQLKAALDEYGRGLSTSIRGSMDASDHAPFEWAGYKACLLIEDRFNNNPCYHRSCDTVDTQNYIDYVFAADMVRSVAGFLADYAVVILPPPCPGDLNGDAFVGQADLAILLAAWGTGAGGDLDGDGDTDQADLAILLAHYGETCN
jgi:Zn-dependent M28 family amino/carboxypeptidase